MSTTNSKPALVFFQSRYDHRLPEFLSIHRREHVKCLSVFFDVTVIDNDCDYGQVCDLYQPDLALFEGAYSGISFSLCRPIKITNVHSHPRVPKVGFHNADPWCDGRAGFLSDLEHWGIDTVFSIAVTAAEHMPAIADNLFIWPNFVDADVFHDYGQWKTIPVLFVGNKNAQYPWRQRILRLVSKTYPSLICPHPGYGANVLPDPEAGNNAKAVVGEHYARMLNASTFVPTCGTLAKEVVRKHLEIPASRSCLITERSPGLEAAGFRDMDNCVFADEHDVLDKMEYLFRHPDVLAEVTDRGYRLVHSRHTLEHRDQLFQWFTLQKDLPANKKIVQLGPFGGFRAVDRSPEATNAHIVSNGMHLLALHDGDVKLLQGKYDEAERLYLKCVNYIRWMPEPKLRLALCNLYKGDAKAALSWITKPIQFTLAEYKAADPEPVEWAYFIITLLCLGRTRDAAERARQFPWLRHAELDRVRNAMASIDVGVGSALTESMPHRGSRRSIHQLPDRDLKEWVRQLSLMLRACGQAGLAEKVTRCTPAEAGGPMQGIEEIPGSAAEATTYAPGMERRPVAAFKRRLFYQQAQGALKRFVKNLFHRVEARFGDLLPTRLAGYRKDSFCRALRDRASDEAFRAALIIGAAPTAISTRVLLGAAQAAKRSASIFGVSVSKPRSEPGPKRVFMQWHQLPTSSPGSLASELNQITVKIRETHLIDRFDVLIIDGAELETQVENADVFQRQLDDARCVVLEDINGRLNQALYTKMLDDPRFSLVERDLLHRNGYAIFERCDNENGLGDLPALSPGHRSNPSGLEDLLETETTGDDSLTTPTVSVVMTVFNGERFLREAVESILSQSFRDFEFIIIDDGSTDSSASILEFYRDQDARVRVYHQENRGIVESLNRGCGLARGKYIARMDADDVSIPIRLERQLAFLDENPLVGLVGCGIYDNIDASGAVLHTSYLPKDNETIQRTLLERWCFLHPSIMFRSVFHERVGGYRKEFESAEDHDFILRILEHCQAHNLHERLIKYRLNPQSLSVISHQYQNELGDAAMRLAHRRRNGQPEDLEAEMPRLLELKRRRTDTGGLGGAMQSWRDSFYAANRYYGFGCRELCAGHLERARRCFVQSLGTNALFAKSWIGVAISLMPFAASRLRFVFRSSMQRDSDLRWLRSSVNQPPAA